MDPDRHDDRPADRRIMVPAIVATAVLLIAGFAIALMPALVFHSGLASVYGGYPGAGMFVALASLIPANVWALSVLWRRQPAPKRAEGHQALTTCSRSKALQVESAG